MCVCVCPWAALAQLTDKIDPKYIIPSESAGFHDDARPKKNMLAILDFWKNGRKKTFFSAVSQYPDHLEDWFLWGWPLIRYWELNFHFIKKRKTTYPVTQVRLGSPRQDGPHVLCHHPPLSCYVLHCNSMYSTVLRLSSWSLGTFQLL